MSVLESIVAGVKLDQREREISKEELEQQIRIAPPVRDPLEALRAAPFSIIAEVKRSSPSKGVLASIERPEDLAELYRIAGASVVSVLTEQRRFGGSLRDFDAVRRKVEIPLLRKDFMVNDYLIKESRAHGTDLVLLIVAALPDPELEALYQLTKALGMRALIEVHDQYELERALSINPEIIGINSRNLHSLEVDTEAFQRLIPLIPDHIYKVAESGILTVADAQRARKAGADAILVGEALVRSSNPGQLIKEFMEVPK